jgi:hypothetical protein
MLNLNNNNFCMFEKRVAVRGDCQSLSANVRVVLKLERLGAWEQLLLFVLSKH